MSDPIDLDDDDRQELISTLREIIAESRFPRSPRIRALRRVLDKLDPPAPSPDPLPPPKPTERPSSILTRKRRR